MTKLEKLQELYVRLTEVTLDSPYDYCLLTLLNSGEFGDLNVMEDFCAGLKGDMTASIRLLMHLYPRCDLRITRDPHYTNTLNEVRTEVALTWDFHLPHKNVQEYGDMASLNILLLQAIVSAKIVDIEEEGEVSDT